jgi:hypothetical protein
MTDYSSWPTRKLSVTTLRLDSQNPRLTNQGRSITQPEIINYLIENEKVIELAKSIISKGYFLNESPIVVNEDGKYIVLEGNRRIAACKILINPDLIKSAPRRSTIKKSLETFDLSLIKKVDTIISPTRKKADIMIMNRHTGGSVVEKWDKTKQDRFIYNRFKGGETVDEMAFVFGINKSEIRKALQRYNVFIEINKLNLEEREKRVLQEEVKFSMTNIERIYESKYGKDFLGIDFNEQGNVIKKLPKAEFEKRLATITEKVIKGEINSRTLNTEKEKADYFKKLISEGDYDVSIKPDKKYNFVDDIEANEETDSDFGLVEKSKEKKPSASEHKMFSKDLLFVTGNKRIDQIFIELRSLSLKNQINASAVLMRSYIDMLTYQFFKKKGCLNEMVKEEGLKLKEMNGKIMDSVIAYLNEIDVKENRIDRTKLQKVLKLKGSLSKDFIPSLRYMLDYLAKSDVISEAKLKQTLQSHLNKNDTLNKIIGHNELNLLVHNEYHHTDIADLKSAWNRLEPLLEYMINEIKE